MSEIRQARCIDPAAVITKRAVDLQPGDRIVTTLWPDGQEIEEVGMRECPTLVQVWFTENGGYSCFQPGEKVLVAKR